MLVFDVDSECTSEQLFNKRGVCVPKIQELIRISRQIPYSFRTGDNDTTPIVKCSDLTGKFKLKCLQNRVYRILKNLHNEKFLENIFQRTLVESML